MKIRGLTILALSVSAFAQTTVQNALMKHWKTAGEFTLAVAAAMPAEGYDFRPYPEEMSFGHLMAHIATLNLSACSNASGIPRPATPANIAPLMRDESSDVDRESALRFLAESFDFCNRTIASMPPEKLDATAGPQNFRMQGFEWLWAYFTHTAHHRGQAEVYLRLKGIKPPTYTF